MASKVKFNLSNVHIAPIKETGEYDEVFALPGAVSLTLDAQGDMEKFYADGIVYYQTATNNGYEGTLEIAMITDEFRQKVLGEVLSETKKLLVESVDDKPKDFAMGFKIDGDVNDSLFWYYRCTVSRPSTSANTTEEQKTPQTDSLTISCVSRADKKVRAKSTADTPEEVITSWFSAPVEIA